MFKTSRFFFINLRTFGLLIAWIGILNSSYMVIYLAFLLNETNGSSDHEDLYAKSPSQLKADSILEDLESGVHGLQIIVHIFRLITSIWLLHGIQMRIREMMVPWLMFMLTLLCYSIVFPIFVCTYSAIKGKVIGVKMWQKLVDQSLTTGFYFLAWISILSLCIDIKQY